MELEQLAFPELGDSIFDEGENWQLNARVVRRRNDTASLPWTGYIQGYRAAANRLLERVTQDIRDQDKLLYPFLFLWQHHTEIILKHILEMLSYLLNQKIPNKTKKSHRIEILWNEMLKMAPMLPEFMDSTREGIEDLQAATNIVNEFSGIFASKNQEGARYPVTLNSTPSLSQDFKGIYLDILDTRMSDLSNYLGCIHREVEVRVIEEILLRGEDIDNSVR